MNQDSFNQFLDLMGKLCSSNGETIRNAEIVLSNVSKQTPEFLMLALVNVLKQQNIDLNLKQMAALLIRQRGTTINNYFLKCSPETKELLKRDLIEIIRVQTDKELLRIYCDMIAVVSSTILCTEEWEEILQLSVEWIQSPNEVYRDSSMRIVSGIMQNAVHLKKYHSRVGEMAVVGIKDSSVRVRLLALKNIIHLLVHNQSLIPTFRQFLPQIYEIVTGTIQHDEEIARSGMSLLHDVADVLPELLEDDIDRFLYFAIVIYKDAKLEEETRFLAGSLFVSMLESVPKVIRTKTHFFEEVLPLTLQIMADLDDEDDHWLLVDSADEDDEEEGCKFGRDMIERISNCVKGSRICPILFNYYPTMLSATWKTKVAALFSLSAIREGSATFLESHMDKVMGVLVPMFTDNHYRVRWAAFTTLGLISKVFAPSLQRSSHSVIFPIILKALSDPHMKIRAQAVGALVDYTLGCDADMLEPHLNPILTQIIHNINEATNLNLFQFISNHVIALSSIASTVNAEFTPYLECVPSILFPLLQKICRVEKYRKLSGIIIEASCVMAGSVDQDDVPFLQTLIDLMISMHGDIHDASDERIKILQVSWVVIVQILGTEFAPYFKYLAPDLITLVASNPDIEIFSVDEVSGLDENEWQLRNVDSANIAGINTHALKEKSNACSNLSLYITSMAESFYPFIPQVLPLCKGLISYNYSKDVRISGAEIMAGLMMSAETYFNNLSSSSSSSSSSYDNSGSGSGGGIGGSRVEVLSSLLNELFPLLYAAINKESSRRVKANLILSMFELISHVGAEILGPLSSTYPSQITSLITQLIQIFFTEETKINELLANTEEEDKEDIEEEITYYYELFIYATDLIGKMIEFYKDEFLPFLQPLLPHYQRYLNGTERKTRHAALCLLADLIEFGGSSGATVVQPLLPYLIQALSETNRQDICQTAVYGIGVAAEKAMQLILPFADAILSSFIYIIKNMNKKKKKQAELMENAISSLGKIILAQPTLYPLPQVLPVWLSGLPVHRDQKECPYIHSQLCQFLIIYPDIMLGDNLSNLPKILAIFADIINSEHCNPDISSSILNLLKTFKEKLPADHLKHAFSSLKSKQARTINKLMK